MRLSSSATAAADFMAAEGERLLPPESERRSLDFVGGGVAALLSSAVCPGVDRA